MTDVNLSFHRTLNYSTLIIFLALMYCHSIFGMLITLNDIYYFSTRVNFSLELKLDQRIIRRTTSGNYDLIVYIH
jgi:hypothetical protein